MVSFVHEFALEETFMHSYSLMYSVYSSIILVVALAVHVSLYHHQSK